MASSSEDPEVLPPVGNEAVAAQVDEAEACIPASTNTFPLAEGMCLSYWLQGVRSNPLLDHRSSDDIPTEADVVIIGSGVRQPFLPSNGSPVSTKTWCDS